MNKMNRTPDNKNISSDTRNMVTAAVFLGIAVAFQFAGRSFPEISRMFVGPVVNAVILLTVYFASPRYGFMTAALTPLLAYAVGQLNPVLLPMVPFIAVANLLFAFSFALFKRTPVERVISSVVGSGLKTLFLYLVVRFIIPVLNLGLPKKVMDSLPTAFGITQFYAALLGSAAAFILIPILRRGLKPGKPDRI